MKHLVTIITLVVGWTSAYAEEMHIDADTRSWFRNVTNPGSCVQCSIGMCGVNNNDRNAALLLFPSEYGPPELHGSWPSRVEGYCNKRGIRAYNVTGSKTYDWMKWACKTGRFAAIGAGQAHFQTLYGYNEGDEKPWLVCNNNSPTKIDAYTDEQFRQLHEASGQWVVILKRPTSPPPDPSLAWWKSKRLD